MGLHAEQSNSDQATIRLCVPKHLLRWLEAAARRADTVPMMLLQPPRLALVSALCLGLAPGTLQAHPHIFIDAGLHLIVEEGRVTAVEVTWLYDELYSLLLMQDHGLDEDFDLALTEEEVIRMLGFDLDWSFGFEGGLVLRRGAQELAVGPPQPISLELVAPGQIRTTHRREVTDPGGDALLDAQVYDPEFYAAFEMTGDMTVEGADCAMELTRADLDAAYAVLEGMLNDIGGSVAEEDNYPEVGIYFADHMEITCAG